MAEDFVIRIRADDAATATVKKIQAALGKVTEPVEKSQKRIARLGDMGQVSLSKLQKGFGRVESAARGVIDKIVEIIPGLTAISGAASLAGLSALAVKFGNFGFSLNKSSKLLGMNAQDLAAWHVAAKRAGVSAEEFDSSMSSSQMAIRDAAYGKNPEAMMVLNRLGVQIARNRDGTVADYNAVQQQLMHAIEGIKSVQAQREVANTFSWGALLPMIQQGTYDEDKARAYRKGLVPTPEEIARSQQFHQDINDLEDSVSGLGNSIGSKLVPILDPLVRGFSKWLDSHRAQIADQIGNAVQKFATWLQSIDWDSVVSKAGKFFDAIGGIKGVAIAIAAITFAGPISGVLSLISSLTTLATSAIPGAVAGIAGISTAGVAAMAALAIGAGISIKKIKDSTEAGHFAGRQGSSPNQKPLRKEDTNEALWERTRQMGKDFFSVHGDRFVSRRDRNAHGSTGGQSSQQSQPGQSAQSGGLAQAAASAVSGSANAAENSPGMDGISASLASRAGYDAVMAALQAQQRYGVPAAVTLAQYGLESGFGSHMPAGSNNPFGIKAAAGQPYVEAQTTEFVNGVEQRVTQRFAKFDSLADAFYARSKLLATGSAYALARQHQDDPMAYAAALTGHYATDPWYGAKLQAVMAGVQPIQGAPGISGEPGASGLAGQPGQPGQAGEPGDPGAPAAAPQTDGDRDSRIAQMQQAAPQVGPQQQTAAIQHQVTVDFKNVPQGARVDTKSSDGGYLPTRVNYAMGTNFGAMP